MNVVERMLFSATLEMNFMNLGKLSREVQVLSRENREAVLRLAQLLPVDFEREHTFWLLCLILPCIH